MLFSPTLKPNPNAVFIQTHIPRTGGTSFRHLLLRAFGTDAFIHNYNGELQNATRAQIDQCRFIAGHVPYGMHEYFQAEPYYITITRDPVRRYQSLYATFLTNKNSNLHAYAARYNIDDFLKFSLNSDIPHVRGQHGNLQCRLVSGSDDFQQARDFIDNKYLLACPLPEIDCMVEMLRAFIGAGKLGRVETIHRTAPRMEDLPSRLRLSDATLALLLECEAEDFHLHSHVQQSFRRKFEDWQHWHLQQEKRPVARPSLNPLNFPIPPKELRFMGETDESFQAVSRALADKILNLLPDNPGEDFRLLDVGCGYGRLAYGLRECEFGGRYVGFDILSRQIDWLNQNFDGGDNYRFHHVDLHNERYNPTGLPLADVELPLEQGAFDCMVATSVFTHMYEDDIIQYIRRIKPFLKDGGLLVATFFRIHPGFKLGDTFPNCTFSLTKQVSENSFIASEAEPLWVIAYKEAFLLALFAREGFDVVSQRKGRWLTEPHALEFQDWFILRKKSTAQPVAATKVSIRPPRGNHPSSACIICGSLEFGPGPNGRLSSNGSPPACLRCGSLERHRALRGLFHCLPIGTLNWRRALQVRSSSLIRSDWFHSLDDMAVADAEQLMGLLPSLPDDGYDLIVLDQVLEYIRDDRAALAGLLRKLSKRGIALFIPAANARPQSIDFTEPVGPYGQWHAYSADLLWHFNLEDNGIHSLVVTAVDPCTDLRMTIHLLFRDAADHHEFHAHLGATGDRKD